MSLVIAHAHCDVIAYPVTTVTTAKTTDLTTISPFISTTRSSRAIDIEAAIRQLQMLQSNPALMNSMDESVRQLVLSLGSSGETSVTQESVQSEVQQTVSTVISDTSSTIKESERHAYQQEKNRRMYQEKQRSRNKSNDPTVPVTSQGQEQTTKSRAKEKRKPIILGVEAQKMLPNTDIRTKQTAASTKSSSSNASTDKFAKKPSHEKWDNDRIKVTSVLASSSSTSSDAPTKPT